MKAFSAYNEPYTIEELAQGPYQYGVWHMTSFTTGIAGGKWAKGRAADKSLLWKFESEIRKLDGFGSAIGKCDVAKASLVPVENDRPHLAALMRGKFKEGSQDDSWEELLNFYALRERIWNDTPIIEVDGVRFYVMRIGHQAYDAPWVKASEAQQVA